jgi:hypothetical protein
LGTLEATLEPSALRDAFELAEVMRDADKAECEALGGGTPLDHLLKSLEVSSVAYTLRFNGEVAAMYGAGPLDDTLLCARGVAWLLTGRAVARYPKAFWKHSLLGVGQLLSEFATLEQAIDARYEAALRWARRLGFTVGPALPLGPKASPFHHISIGGFNG